MTDEPSEKVDEPVDELDARLSDLEAKVQAARQKAAPGKTDDLDERLEALKTAAQKARHGFTDTRPPDAKQQRLDRESTQGLGFGLALAYAIIGVPMFGALIGWAIDARSGSFLWRSVLAVVGMIIGIVAAIVMINRNNETR